MKEKRKCTNCAFCQRFENFGEKRMRCWQEPGVCDHAFTQTIEEGENYVCDEHRFQDERDAELYEEAFIEYRDHKNAIKKLEEKYPSLKNLVDND
jgi:hypothetical protein